MLCLVLVSIIFGPAIIWWKQGRNAASYVMIGGQIAYCGFFIISAAYSGSFVAGIYYIPFVLIWLLISLLVALRTPKR